MKLTKAGLWMPILCHRAELFNTMSQGRAEQSCQPGVALLSEKLQDCAQYRYLKIPQSEIYRWGAQPHSQGGGGHDEGLRHLPQDQLGGEPTCQLQGRVRGQDSREDVEG